MIGSINPAKIDSGQKLNQHLVLKEAKSFYNSINYCALELFRQIDRVRHEEHKNFLFFTPNILGQLSMLYAGAPEDLKPIIESAFKMEEIIEAKWHKNFKAWSKVIQRKTESFSGATPQSTKSDTQGSTFSHVQMALVKKTETFKTKFSYQFATNLFYYNPKIIEFATTAESKTLVHQYMVDKFQCDNDFIKEEFSNTLILAFVSAALFKVQLEYPFKKENTIVQPFFNSDKTTSQVMMMHMELDQIKMAFDHSEIYKQVEIVELPLNGNLSLLLIDVEKWTHMKDYINSKNIQALLDDRENRFRLTAGLRIEIPKIEIKDKTNLLKELDKTNFADFITQQNFSTMFENCQHLEAPPLVSESKFILDEGTNHSPLQTSSRSPSCDPSFILDHPFGLAIVDNETNTIIAMGEILKLENNKS